MQYIGKQKLAALWLALIMALALAQSAAAQTYPPSAQACTNAGSYGMLQTGTQISCTLVAPNTLGASAIIMATPSVPVPSPSLQCRGLTLSGYTTQGLVGPAAPNPAAPYASNSGCIFQVTQGTAPENSPLGTAILTLAAPAAAGTVQLNLAFCTDLTCGAAVLQAALPYLGSGGTSSCWSAGCGSVITSLPSPQFSAANANAFCGLTTCGTVLVPPSTPQGYSTSTGSCYEYTCGTVLTPPTEPQFSGSLPSGLTCTTLGPGYYCHQ